MKSWGSQFFHKCINIKYIYIYIYMYCNVHMNKKLKAHWNVKYIIILKLKDQKLHMKRLENISLRKPSQSNLIICLTAVSSAVSFSPTVSSTWVRSEQYLDTQEPSPTTDPPDTLINPCPSLSNIMKASLISLSMSWS